MTATCPRCEGAGIVELEAFHMVGPTARETMCVPCGGTGAVPVAAVTRINRQQNRKRAA